VSELLVAISQDLVGAVTQGANGRLHFTYEEGWRDRDDSYPLSLSMPLGEREYGDGAIRPFLEGLLPDNADILQTWARRFQVSPRNPFSLLSHMGEDCAGALQFVRPERYESVFLAGQGGVDWLTEEAIADRLRDLVQRHGTGRLAGDQGYFSLAGAQPKMALFYDGEGWGIPFGTMPTTHVLKPPAQAQLHGLAANEHLCLRLAQELGMETARSEVSTFAGEQALVVRRYDRLRMEDGRWIRIHQEDAAQALAVSPLRKYEREGGPGAPAIVQLLLEESSDPDTDVGAFLDTLALNWVMGGTDAHAKNYSLLIRPGSVRLAPLYDLVSILPYPHFVHPREAKLSMRVHREYALWKIRRRHWEGLASDCRLDPEPVVERVREVVAATPEALERAVRSVREEGVQHEVVGRIATMVQENAERCLRMLDG